MQLDLPKGESFHVPEGTYRGILIQAREIPKSKRDSSSTLWRLVFSIPCPEDEYVTYSAGKNYHPDLCMGSDLRTDLDTWLQKDYKSITAMNGKIDLPLLLHRPADLIITHRYSPGYAKPYVYIKAIHPAGTLALTHPACEEFDYAPEQP